MTNAAATGAQTMTTPAQNRMLAAIAKHTQADGWAEWTSVYNEWDPKNIPPQFAGQAAQKCWTALERHGLVESQGDKVRCRQESQP